MVSNISNPNSLLLIPILRERKNPIKEIRGLIEEGHNVYIVFKWRFLLEIKAAPMETGIYSNPFFSNLV